jgi:methylated-DNA-[protein]-cysteine S-methyltransferase
MHISTQTYLSPYGEITLGSFDTRLCLCNWSDKKNKTAVENRLKKYLEVNNFIQGSNALLTTAAEQLDAYFKSKLTHFDLPLILAGSDFQKQVWRTLQTIPYGHTTSYLELAQRIGKDKRSIFKNIWFISFCCFTLFRYFFPYILFFLKFYNIISILII